MTGTFSRTAFPRFMAFLSLVFALVLLTTGCDHFFGHDKQVQDPLTVKEQGLSCVRSVGSDVQAFFRGEDRDPVRIADCLSSALTKFSENTRGANPDGWTRGELSSFFETYFKEESQALKVESNARRVRGDHDFSASDRDDTIEPFDTDWVAQARRRAVVTELFRWKASLFGGGDTTLSRHELNRIREILVKARGPLAVWRGQGRLLSMKAEFVGQSADVAQLERLTTSIRELSSLLVGDLSLGVSYLSNFLPREPMKLKTMARSFEQAGVKVLENEERMKLVEAVKIVVLGGDGEQISGDEWSELVRQASELWITVLRVRYGIMQNISAYDRDVDLVGRTAEDFTKAMKRMIDRHGSRIDNDKIRALVTQLEANSMLPDMIRAKSVNSTLEVIFGKLLAGNSLVDRVQLSQGLQAQHLRRLLEVVTDWVEGQRIVMALAGPSHSASLQQTKLQMSHVAVSSQNGVGEIARQQMSELILRGRPLVHDQSGRLLILPTNLISGYTQNDLETLNITRVLMSAAMRGYSYENTRAGTLPQITEAEIQELFTDLKAIGRDLGIVDVRSLQSGVRTFMEANIFLSISDGDAFISFHEMVEWFEMVMGAGTVADRIHDDFSREGMGSPHCGIPPMDVFGKMRLSATCFRENAVPILKNRLSHLPTFIRTLEAAEKQKKVPELLQALERATRALGDSDLPIESSDVRVMSPVIHYAEALFARFDTDRSTILETPEVWSVFPLIRPFIQKVAVDENGVPVHLSSFSEKLVFSWLLDKGTPPRTDIWSKLKLLDHATGTALRSAFRWVNFEIAGRKIQVKTEQATFDDVIKILASFQLVGREKKNKDVIAYYMNYASLWEKALSRGDRRTLEKTRDLFQCSTEADVDLLRLIQARRVDIFAIDPNLNQEDQARSFAARFESMIQADPQLQVLCLAF